jgi:hypothetical protein
VQRKNLKESDFKRIHRKLGCQGCMFAVAEMLDLGPCCSYPGQIVPTKEGCPKRCVRLQPLSARPSPPAPHREPKRMTAGTGRR